MEPPSGPKAREFFGGSPGGGGWEGGALREAFAFAPQVPDPIWGQVSGPATVTFAEPTNPLTLATFTEPGEYVLP